MIYPLKDILFGFKGKRNASYLLEYAIDIASGSNHLSHMFNKHQNINNTSFKTTDSSHYLHLISSYDHCATQNHPNPNK